MLHFLLILINRLNTTESVVFFHCRFSLFLKDPFFQIIVTVSVLCFFLVEMWVGLQCVIVVFPGHTHLLIGINNLLDQMV